MLVVVRLRSNPVRVQSQPRSFRCQQALSSSSRRQRANDLRIKSNTGSITPLSTSTSFAFLFALCEPAIPAGVNPAGLTPPLNGVENLCTCSGRALSVMARLRRRIAGAGLRGVGLEDEGRGRKEDAGILWREEGAGVWESMGERKAGTRKGVEFGRGREGREVGGRGAW